MDRIDIAGSLKSDHRGKFFARAAGTQFKTLAQDSEPTVVELYDEIGFWGVTAKDFRDQLKGVQGDFTLRLNSPGGDVFDGIAIFNDILAHKGRVRVEVVGLAASIASVIAMAGDEIAIAPNAFFMVHNAWTIALGNRHDMTDMATVLGQIDEAIARTYVGRAKVGIRAVRDMMDAETWLPANDAVEKGFADGLLTAAAPEAVQAKFDLAGVYANAPAAFAWTAEEPAEAKTPRDVERELMRDAGPRSRSQARTLMRAMAGKPQDATHDAGGEGIDGNAILQALRAASAELQPSK